MSEAVELELREFLLRDKENEEIAFAVWFPAIGKRRLSIIIRRPIFPLENERKKHGNVSATPEFLDRAKEIARRMKAGLVMIHTHPRGSGWQGLSKPDEFYERIAMAREVFGVTGLPLVGMTLSGDKVWSARYYPKDATTCPVLQWCINVRVVGKRLRIDFNPKMKPKPSMVEEQTQTASVWGEEYQTVIMRLRVGVIGAGSVGGAVAEILARVGVGELYIMDYDTIKPHNLDRALGASQEEAKTRKPKADMVAENASKSATTPGFRCVGLDATSIVEEDGYRSAIDCDVIFSCVDRPWPRQVMNHTAYSCLIPVIDGGVSFKIAFSEKLIHGMFRTQTVGPSRACLKCLRALDAGEIQLDREGRFDDPAYISGLPTNQLPSRQNIMPFTMGLASLETIQFIELLTGMAGMGDLGQQPYDYRTGEILPVHKSCSEDCEFVHLIGFGDSRMPFLSRDLSKERTASERGSQQSIADLAHSTGEYGAEVRLVPEGKQPSSRGDQTHV